MKNCQALFRVSADPSGVNVTPSVLYEKRPCLPEPGRMSAVARNQIRPPETVAPAASLPSPVVFQLPSIVRPLTITTLVAPLSRLTPIQADESRSRASPARSPLA